MIFPGEFSFLFSDSFISGDCLNAEPSRSRREMGGCREIGERDSSAKVISISNRVSNPPSTLPSHPTESGLRFKNSRVSPTWVKKI